MLRDLDLSLAAWLEEALPGTSVRFDPLPEEEAPPAAVLELELVDVRLDSDASTSGWASLRDDRGVVVGRVPPTRSYRCTYLVRARAHGALAEHDLLGRVLAAAALHGLVPQRHLAGALAEAAEPVLAQCAPTAPLFGAGDRWRAQQQRGVAMELSVLAPLPMSLVAEAADAPAHIELGARKREVRRGSDGEPGSRPRPTATISEGH